MPKREIRKKAHRRYVRGNPRARTRHLHLPGIIGYFLGKMYLVLMYYQNMVDIRDEPITRHMNADLVDMMEQLSLESGSRVSSIEMMMQILGFMWFYMQNLLWAVVSTCATLVLNNFKRKIRPMGR